MNSPHIIVLAGYSCAGKSTLARTFCEIYEASQIHQQDVYREIAAERGFTSAREWLREVGTNTFIETTMDRVAHMIQTIEAKPIVVLDEAYNESGLKHLTNIFGEDAITLVQVNASADARGSRIAERLGTPTGASEELRFRDDFLKDAGLDVVLDRAQIHVLNEGFVRNTAYELGRQLEQLGLTLDTID